MQIAFIDSAHPILAERLSAAGHTCTYHHTVSDEGLAAALHGTNGIIVRSRRVPASLLAGLPDLRFVGRVGSGLENIDVAWCNAHGVRVVNAPEGNRDGVGEMAVAHLLVLMKHIHRANAQVHQGLWLREENRGSDLSGRTVGIIGYGIMGEAFARKLQGFDVRILAHDKYRSGFGTERVKESTLDDVLRESDVISLHLPLTEETKHYANAAFFARVHRPIWFLNTARGPIVHTEALLDALDAERVRGAGLGVLEFERPTLDGLDHGAHAHTIKRLMEHDRVLLTPHVAGVTHEGKYNMAAVLADKILNDTLHDIP